MEAKNVSAPTPAQKGEQNTMAVKKAAAPNAATSLATLGKSYFVYINTGTADAPEWTKVGGQRGGSLSRKADTLDATSKDTEGWKATLQGLKEWSIDLDSLIMTNDEGLQVLNAAFLAGQNVQLKFEYPDKSYVTGWAAITEMSLETPHDDLATYKGTLSGVGALSEVKKG